MNTLTVEYREMRPIKPGSYRAKIRALEQKPSTYKEGERALTVEFELLNAEAGRVLRKTYGLRLGPKAKLTSLVTRLIGPLKDGQVVNLKALIGRECEIVVTNEMGSEGRTFSKIVDVFAVEGGSNGTHNGAGVQGVAQVASRTP
ncbi:hypothetical protein LM602_06685 [Candidatus Acetothermia bacterium]|jgi:hypothetical protein|nr:hypothetical protein [Candidatus Acetothermia bacterium]MCI2432220.1 hypothetical protein [Candidatus Acetothermia bacterium]MCI2436123.1 hypothetical protein [Candidatus Acetothermia bacterium]